MSPQRSLISSKGGGGRKSGEKGSDPGATQTHDLQNRKLTLYSTKLLGKKRRKDIKIIDR